MPINLIACVANYKNKLAIGKNNELLFKLHDDLAMFSQITKHSLHSLSKLNRNVIVMGRKTWFSLPLKKRPLQDRLNLILTNNNELHDISPYPSKFKLNTISDINSLFDKNMYFITFEQLIDFYKRTSSNIFVIGGSEIYNKFLEEDNKLIPENIYLTEVYNFKPVEGEEPTHFMNKPNQTYKLISISSKINDIKYNLNYRFLKYKKFPNGISQENKYLDLCNYILKNGNERPDRTGVGTISVFGTQLTFNISNSIPLLTSKRVAWKHCIEELLWFLRGDTDSKILQKKGVKIWNGNTSREFLDSRGLHHFDEGILGPGYGWQWRFFGAGYSQSFSDTTKIDTSEILGGFDQIEHVISELKTNPFSRKILVSAWNPSNASQMALEPCHFAFQFYVEQDSTGQKHLSCHFMMRSNDIGCGTSFNLMSYAVLTYIIALKCDMQPKNLIYTCSDAHIYKNHLTQIKEQLNRELHPLPKLIINKNVKTKDWKDITISDFEVIGYFPEPSIKMDMAI